MPNWCYTHSYFVGNKENVYAFYIDFLKSQEVIKIGDKGWLGRLIHYNYDNKYIDDKEGNFRGFYIDISEPFEHNEYNYAVELISDDAWYIADGFYNYVCDRYDLDHYYYAEEPGFSIYETNDVEGIFFVERYILKIYKDDFDELIHNLKSNNADSNVIKLIENISQYNTEYFTSKEDIKRTLGFDYDFIKAVLDSNYCGILDYFNIKPIDVVW